MGLLLCAGYAYAILTRISHKKRIIKRNMRILAISIFLTNLTALIISVIDHTLLPDSLHNSRFFVWTALPTAFFVFIAHAIHIWETTFIDPTFDRGLTIDQWQYRVKTFNWERFGSDCNDTKLRRAILLIHEEITECYDERCDLTEGYQPWGMRVELADIAIRIIDFCARALINLELAIIKHKALNEYILTINGFYEHIDMDMTHQPHEKSTELINSLHHQLSRFTHDWRKTGKMDSEFIVEMFETVFMIAWLANCDLEQEMIDKMQINKNRPYTKGKGFEGKFW